MKTKTGNLAFTKLFFLFAFLISANFGFAAPSNGNGEKCTCDEPYPLLVNQGTTSLTFSWSAVSGATTYKAYYYRREDHYTSSEISTTALSHEFTSLPSGTYVFYFYTVCGSETSNIHVTVDIIM